MIIFRLTFRMPEQFLIKTGKKKKEEGKGNIIFKPICRANYPNYSFIPRSKIAVNSP